MRRITLIGMPGSGKSAVGRILASRLGWSFVDTDKYIEARHGLPLQALIDAVGEDRFKKLEEEAILGLELYGPAVISTGGSVVYSEAAMRHLDEISMIVFLDLCLDEMRAHIDSQAPRGIVGLTGRSLEELLAERLPLYRRWARLTISFCPEPVEEAADLVLSRLPEGWQKD